MLRLAYHVLLFCPLPWTLIGLIGVLGFHGLFPSATQPYYSSSDLNVHW